MQSPELMERERLEELLGCSWAGLHGRAAVIERRALRLYSTDPDLTLRQWAEKHGRIADGSTDGLPFRCSLVPYLAEPLEALSDPYVEEVTVKKCTQAGATVGLILLQIAFHMDQDPTRILAIIPSVEEAEKWSKEKLLPALEAMPRVRGKVGEESDGQRGRQRDQTILRKVFPGGTLTIAGSNSGRAFRMVTMRVVVGDDVDAWNATAGAAGDQVTLARRRTDRELARKLLWVSSPEGKVGESRIDKLYQKSARRGRFSVPCPNCGNYQVLRRGGRDTPYGLKWEKGRPETAEYLCEHCACLIAEKEKWAMVQRGRYLTDQGEPVREARTRTVGYWFNAYTVVLAGSEWPRLAEEWLRVHRDPTERKSFINTIDAELFEETNEDVNAGAIDSRREVWTAEIPHGVGLLTMAVDVQGSWVEAAVWGWGSGEECWLIYHERIHWTPTDARTFARIEAIRTRPWQHESGQQFRVWPSGVDARHKGPEAVYPYVREREQQAVYAMLGHDSRAKQVLHQASTANKYGCRPWTISTIPFKDILFDRLRLTEPGPGYIHIPAPFEHGGDSEFVAQFEAEVRHYQTIGGRQVHSYRKIRGRNEAIDLYVIGLAALHALGPDVVRALPKRAAAWSTPPEEKPPEPPPRPPRTGGGGWARRF